MNARAWVIRLAVLLPGLATSSWAADDFRPIVSGEDIAQFTLVKIDAKSMTVKDGEIRLSGKPNGYFATKQAYKNYVLRFEWMYERPETLKGDSAFTGNSGLLVHIKDHKVWPKSVEVQLANSDAGNIFSVDGAKFSGEKDSAAQHKAVKPVGEWNAMEVICKDGAVSCSLNGVAVARGSGELSDGVIGWQSEGNPIRFRKLAIKTAE
jgi:Domain of Unknown Function (DUF1080)